MQIAFDLDDVLVDFLGRFLDFHNEEYNTSFEPEKFVYDDGYYQVLGVEPTEVGKRYTIFQKSPHYKKISPFSYSIELLEKLRLLGFDIHIVTGRDTGRLKETKQLVNRYFSHLIPWKKVHFGSDFHEDKSPLMKHEICTSKGFEVLVEDSAKHALKCAEVGVKILLFDKPWNQGVKSHGNIYRIVNTEEPIQEILTFLETL